MKFGVRIILLVVLVTGTLTQEGFDLSDALGDADPTPAKPAKPQEPKSPEKPKGGGELDLLDAFGPAAPTLKPKKPSSGDSGGFNLNDALGPDTNPKPDKPVINPPKSGEGGGNFGDSDLDDVTGGDYKPDRTGGRAVDPGYDPQGGADHPQDAGLPWDQFLKMLNANMPEEFYMWISNLKQILTPLVDRVRDLLQAMP
ncbi:CD99 molecule isoform X4 [Betta splendens]|uniref:CD99 molecule isoform X4 n=1 Tax=Betta splendens TaxID=158456 RepID=A0A6P7LNF1_BETSP|nr:CD99 molecule isoform X4 [Betta splendens]